MPVYSIYHGTQYMFLYTAKEVYNNFACWCFYICPEGDTPLPADHPPPHVLHHAAHLVLLHGPGVVGVHVEDVIEMDVVPAPVHTPATAHTLGHGSAEVEEAALGDGTREHALAPQTGTEIEEGTTHHGEEQGKKNC